MAESKITLYALDHPKLTMDMLKNMPSSIKFVALFGNGETEDAHQKNKDGNWESVRTGVAMLNHNFTDAKLITYINDLWKTPFYNHCALIFAKDKYEFEKAVDFIMSGKMNKINLLPLAILNGYRIPTTKKTTSNKTSKKSITRKSNNPTTSLKGTKTNPQYKYAIETRYNKPVRIWCNLHQNNYWYGADLNDKEKYVGGTLMEIPISYSELKKFAGNNITFYKTLNEKIKSLNLPDGLKYF